jgi:hypothetical protein
VFHDALDADVDIISLAVELVGLVVESAELVVLPDFFFLTGELQHNEIFSKHVRLYLGVVLVSAGRAVEKLLFLVDDRQTFLAHCVPAVQVPRGLLL